MVPAAATFPHSQPSYCRKFTTATGAVVASMRVRIRAKKKSFQEKRKQKIAVAASPGAASGRLIRKKACQTPAPSICAASSSDRGVALKKLRIIQMTSERLKVR